MASSKYIIFSHTFEVDADSNDKYIPCVANLGKKYAIAHPTTGPPASAIDIYEFPGKFCRTLTDKVKPVYDMTSTYDGNLAVLSDGNKGMFNSSIKVFDPETGNNLSTFNLDISRPMSLRFGLQNQYVILSGWQLSSLQLGIKLTIVDADGNVECQHIMDTNPEVRNPSRISCGMRYIFVMGENGIAVYEIQGKDLVQTNMNIISVWTEDQDHVLLDISASLWDRLYLVGLFLSKAMLLTEFSEAGKKEKWEALCRFFREDVPKEDRECRIATSDHHIVASFGQKFSVYEYQD